MLYIHVYVDFKGGIAKLVEYTSDVICHWRMFLENDFNQLEIVIRLIYDHAPYIFLPIVFCCLTEERIKQSDVIVIPVLQTSLTCYDWQVILRFWLWQLLSEALRLYSGFFFKEKNKQTNKLKIT